MHCEICKKDFDSNCYENGICFQCINIKCDKCKKIEIDCYFCDDCYDKFIN